MTNKVRCHRCRGQKKYAGIGGVMKDCDVCDGTGSIERELKEVEAVELVESIEDEPVVEEGLAVEAPVVSVAASSVQVGTILPGYDDEFMKAVLAEPGMDALEWSVTYKHIKQLFGINPMTQKWDELLTKVQRAQIREMYAMSKPVKERRVDLGGQQDDAVKNDPEYLKYQRDEKKRKAAADKKARGKSSMGGV